MSTSCSRHQFAGARTDRARQPAPVDELLPRVDRLVDRHAVQAAAQADQPEIVVRGERPHQLRHQPAGAQEHVVLPGHDERAAR